MEEKNRFIYDRLVESDQDIVGHIAYSLYKADKIAFIEKYKNENNGQEPTGEKLKEYQNYCQMESHLEWYRMQAIEVIKGFMDDTMKETLNQLEADFNRNHLQQLASVVEPMKPVGFAKQFGYGVLQSILGAFFFAVIVAAFQFIKSYSPEQNQLIPVPENLHKDATPTGIPADTTTIKSLQIKTE